MKTSSGVGEGGQREPRELQVRQGVLHCRREEAEAEGCLRGPPRSRLRRGVLSSIGWALGLTCRIIHSYHFLGPCYVILKDRLVIDVL